MHPLRCSSSLDHNGPIFFIRQHSMIRIDHPPALPYNARITALSPYDNSPPCPKIQVSSAMASHHSSRVIFGIYPPYAVRYKCHHSKSFFQLPPCNTILVLRHAFLMLIDVFITVRSNCHHGLSVEYARRGQEPWSNCWVGQLVRWFRPCFDR